MKTKIYIDGYNLYYGCLKGTPYKWLDLVKLFTDSILPSSSQNDFSLNEQSIKFFTADIVDKAAKSPDSLNDQQTYHRALKFFSQNNQLEIIKGYYSVTASRAFRIDENTPNKPPNECEYVKVWKLEEKQTRLKMSAIFPAFWG